jgi:IS30 family transposase
MSALCGTASTTVQLCAAQSVSERKMCLCCSTVYRYVYISVTGSLSRSSSNHTCVNKLQQHTASEREHVHRVSSVGGNMNHLFKKRIWLLLIPNATTVSQSIGNSRHVW